MSVFVYVHVYLDRCKSFVFVLQRYSINWYTFCDKTKIEHRNQFPLRLCIILTGFRLYMQIKSILIYFSMRWIMKWNWMCSFGNDIKTKKKEFYRKCKHFQWYSVAKWMRCVNCVHLQTCSCNPSICISMFKLLRSSE